MYSLLNFTKNDFLHSILNKIDNPQKNTGNSLLFSFLVFPLRMRLGILLGFPAFLLWPFPRHCQTTTFWFCLHYSILLWCFPFYAIFSQDSEHKRISFPNIFSSTDAMFLTFPWQLLTKGNSLLPLLPAIINFYFHATPSHAIPCHVADSTFSFKCFRPVNSNI